MYPTFDHPAGYSLDNIISAVGSIHLTRLHMILKFVGTTTDIAAPRAGMYSTVNGGGYATYSGTSTACPHIAGIAALSLPPSNYTICPYPAVRNVILQNADIGLSSLNGNVSNGAG